MRDPEHAKMMLEAAQKDLKCVLGMMDPDVFDDEAFGFHAQQATEKAFKARLSAMGTVYPRTHNLGLLARLVEKAGESIPAGADGLLDLTGFSVRFRYESFSPSGPPLDRAYLGQCVGAPVKYVEDKIVQAGSD